MGLIQKTCELLGKSNLPVYTVAAVAVFKGILRPTFTMMDKKQDPETKKYAAIREGATELIAIPTYISLSWVTQKLAPAFSPEGKTPGALLHNTKSMLGFAGVCVAALYAIPKLCNVAMPHFMKALHMDKKKCDSTHPVNQAPAETSFNAVTLPKGFQCIQVSNPVQLTYAKTPINTGGGLRI
jgi:hypothetical protein